MSEDKKIPLVEMFGPTIQGEGAVIGQQTYFMRFGLCDYKCRMCDSMNAVDPLQVKKNARFLTQPDIADEFAKLYKPNSTRWITLSGGNPCIHDLSWLVSELKSYNFKIAVETQGTFCPDWLKYCDIITVSPKGPGMGEDTVIEKLDQFLHLANFSGFQSNVNLKIVVFDQRDLEFAKMLFERYGMNGYPFYLSLGNPYPPGLDVSESPDWTTHVATLVGKYKMLFEDIQCDPILSSMRFLPQWHIFLWGNAKGK